MLGMVWERVLECGGGKGRSGKMCWGVGKVGGDVGGVGRGVSKCVGVWGR